MDKLLPGVDAAVRGLARDGGPAAAEAIMTTDTRPKTDGRGRRAAGRSAAWPRAPACSPRRWPPCSCVLTTDAVAGTGRARRGAARGHPGHLRPGRLRRLHVHQRHGAAAGQRRVRRSSRRTAELTAAVTAACHDLAQQLLADAEGATKEIAIEVVGAATEDDAVEVGRSVARNNLVKTRAVRQRPQLGPDPRRGRHHRRRLRAGRAGRGGQRRLGLPGRRGRRGPVQGRPDRPGRDHPDRPARRRRRPPRSGPTTCRTPTSTRTRRTRRDRCTPRP